MLGALVDRLRAARSGDARSRSGWPADRAPRGAARGAVALAATAGVVGCSWSPGCPPVRRPRARRARWRADPARLPAVTIVAVGGERRGSTRRRRPASPPTSSQTSTAERRRSAHGDTAAAVDGGGRRVARGAAARDRLADGGDPHVSTVERLTLSLERVRRTGTADGDRRGDGHRQAGSESGTETLATAARRRSRRPSSSVEQDGRYVVARLAQREAGVPRPRRR